VLVPPAVLRVAFEAVGQMISKVFVIVPTRLGPLTAKELIVKTPQHGKVIVINEFEGAPPASGVYVGMQVPLGPEKVQVYEVAAGLLGI